jgi:hypothetical protein
MIDGINSSTIVIMSMSMHNLAHRWHNQGGDDDTISDVSMADP